MGTALMVLVVVFAVNQMARHSPHRRGSDLTGGDRQALRELRDELAARDADLEALHGRVAELENRLDFTERLLARQQDLAPPAARGLTP